ncbi:no similarity [Sorangium cellulosum So ce56]|uniref:No similarity n=2 Tax=Polyangiaceae TaxID=49 RepID=A9FXE7_SORC5|nr:no similarity [Sorangium cellulosum So ce56]
MASGFVVRYWQATCRARDGLTLRSRGQARSDGVHTCGAGVCAPVQGLAYRDRSVPGRGTRRRARARWRPPRGARADGGGRRHVSVRPRRGAGRGARASADWRKSPARLRLRQRGLRAPPRPRRAFRWTSGRGSPILGRMKLTSIAAETVQIASRGEYIAPSGATVRIRDRVLAAVKGTVLYRPGSLDAWEPKERLDRPTAIEVTGETTGAAGRRLIEQEGEARVMALNFASAKNPGGGFLRGAKAQEEDLARCSALYASLVEQREYYDQNRACGSFLYTDHIIYSPDVPFFRDEQHALLDRPFALSILTAPAPNAGEAFQRDDATDQEIRAALERRADMVLAAAGAHGHRCLVLGAWGCGVFRNDPREVADVFARCLERPRFRGAFSRVVFAVYDRGADRPNYRAFQERFAQA